MTRQALYLILILAGALLALSCTPDNQTPSETDTFAHSSGEELTGIRNAADWAGTYHGVLPCADCEGIDTEMTLLDDGTYEISTRYLGKSNENYRESGTFTWSDEEHQIQLDIEDGSRSPYYLVEENQLIHLDLEGNRITGALADHYTLTKRINPLADRYWKLTSLNNIPLDSARTGPKVPHLILHPEDSNASGTGGCNSLSAVYQTSNDNSIFFSRVASTKMACQDADYETDFIRLLEETASYSLQNDKLFLVSADGDTILQFMEQPEFN